MGTHNCATGSHATLVTWSLPICSVALLTNSPSAPGRIDSMKPLHQAATKPTKQHGLLEGREQTHNQCFFFPPPGAGVKFPPTLASKINPTMSKTSCPTLLYRWPIKRGAALVCNATLVWFLIALNFTLRWPRHRQGSCVGMVSFLLNWTLGRPTKRNATLIWFFLAHQKQGSYVGMPSSCCNI